MKTVTVVNLIVLGVVLTIPFAGCKKRPSYLTPLPGARTGLPTEPPPAPPIWRGEGVEQKETGWTPVRPDEYAGWPENRDFFRAQTVYFDFDSSVVKTGEKPKAQTVAAHLTANPSHAVKIEGHCDERGTEEYNRALGERRALALREQLIAEGVAPGRVVTISYGEDRPADPGHDESAWRKNRRGEFLLLTPP